MENLDLREEIFGEVHNMNPSWWTVWGIFFVFTLLAILFILSYFIKYPDIIIANARFVSDVPSVTIPSKLNSKIAALKKHDGEEVRKNDYIIIFADNSDYNDVLQLTEKIKNLDLNSDLTHFFEEGLKNEYKLGDPIQNSWNSLNFQLLENYQIVYQKKYDLEIQRLEKELLYERRIFLKYKRLLELDENLSKIWEHQRNVDSLLATGDVISKVDYNESLMRQLQTKKNSTQEELTFQKSNLEIARIMNSIEALTQRKRERLTELKVNIKKAFLDLKLAIGTWEENYVIKSPIDGRLHYLIPFKENQYVKMNEDLVAITPDTMNFRAELKIPFSGAGKLRRGQKVNIKLNDYPYTEFGVVTGKIVQLSEVANQDHYIGIVIPDKLENRTSYNKTIRIHENALGIAEIITQDRSWLGRLFEKIVFVIRR
ncbi:MAG TPA: HlyD family efflux transporter periplasmic adaptor subunit [Chryseolinea sp.]|nr:HlyD family efflux transporter periplasmic adaptor subunit [Chryseolinea sp.]